MFVFVSVGVVVGGGVGDGAGVVHGVGVGVFVCVCVLLLVLVLVRVCVCVCVCVWAYAVFSVCEGRSCKSHPVVESGRAVGLCTYSRFLRNRVIDDLCGKRDPVQTELRFGFTLFVRFINVCLA